MTNVQPDSILQLIGHVLAAKYLFVGDEVGVFTALAEGPADDDELSRRTNMPRRTLRLLVDGLVACGFVERRDEQYVNSLVAMTYLSGGQGPDLRPILKLWNQIVYPQWLEFEAALRTDKATSGFQHFTPDQYRIFMEGVEALTARSAQALATSYDFGRHRCVLDLGGGTGSFLFSILHHHPHVAATLFEMPSTAAIVKERLARLPSDGAVQLHEGNFLDDPIPTGYDVILLANVVHLFSPTRNRDLLKRIRAAAPDDGRLLLVDFWTDVTHTQPTFAALIAGEFHIMTGEGDVYSADEVGGWLQDSGWQTVTHQPLAGAASLIVAAAT